MAMDGKNELGFTLWELLLVLFLMGALLLTVTPHYSSAMTQVRARVNQANVEMIEEAAQIYRIDVGAYPFTVLELVECSKGTSGWKGPYLDTVPLNPYDTNLSYQIDSLGKVK